MKLTIDRSIWLRGEGVDVSYLRRSPGDGKMCCVGIYLQACGVPPAKLDGMRSAVQVRELLPDEAKWLVRGDCNGLGVGDLYQTNDTSADEARIARLFAYHGGVEVKFI